jgi:hypothetical protein
MLFIGAHEANPFGAAAHPRNGFHRQANDAAVLVDKQQFILIGGDPCAYQLPGLL